MNNIQEAIEAGLWPKSKPIINRKGLIELEAAGYKLFYRGKNADLYFIPGNIPYALMVRSDRCSVFDIPLDLEIEGKGILQNQISYQGFDFAESHGINTALAKIIPHNISEKVLSRTQVIELCQPLEIDLEDETVGLELIFRNYLTGSLYNLNQKGKDPYGLSLPKALSEWSKFSVPLFTPTTKGIKDIPLNSELVRSQYPEIVNKLTNLFIDFTKYAYSKGVVIVDTKFEVFLDSECNWVLGDEVLTPESSRFISVENFEQCKYISMDKQILRDYGKKSNWIDNAKNLKPGKKLSVDVPLEIKGQIISGYNDVHKMFL